MRIVVIGGTGLIGSRLLLRLTDEGHDAVVGALETGINTLTGEGLAGILQDAACVVDVSNSPSFEDGPAMDFFTTSTANLLSYEQAAGVSHHLALSIVGADRLGDSGYMRAKVAQERLIEESSIPYSIVHATQFFEFFRSIADGATTGGEVHLPHVLVQPMAADDVASAIARVVGGSPLNGTIEVAGPEALHLDQFVRRGLDASGDGRRVIADPQSRYFGALPAERDLVPATTAELAETRFDSWLQTHAQSRKAA